MSIFAALVTLMYTIVKQLWIQLIARGVHRFAYRINSLLIKSKKIWKKAKTLINDYENDDNNDGDDDGYNNK